VIVAIKSYDKQRLNRSQFRRYSLKQEIAILQNCQHPNILKLYTTFEDAAKIHLVLEYVPGRTLTQHFKKGCERETEVIRPMLA
jgi:serine/threonine protein kinase